MTGTTNWKRNIILLFLGQGLTVFASVLAAYAILWHVTLVSQSGVAMSLLTLAKFGPQFLVSPLAGVWTDRYNKKMLIYAADSFVAIGTLADVMNINNIFMFCGGGLMALSVVFVFSKTFKIEK